MLKTFKYKYMNKLLLIAGLFLLTVFTPTWGMNDEPEQQITLQQGTSTGSQKYLNWIVNNEFYKK